MKKSISLFVLFLIIGLQITAQTMYVSVMKLNLREAPNTNSSIILELVKGNQVNVITVANNWAYVSYNNQSGYVSYPYLSNNLPTITSKKTQTNEARVLICNSSKAYAYHTHYCSGLNRCRAGVSEVTESQAINSNYVPCKICY